MSKPAKDPTGSGLPDGDVYGVGETFASRPMPDFVTRHMQAATRRRVSAAEEPPPPP